MKKRNIILLIIASIIIIWALFYFFYLVPAQKDYLIRAQDTNRMMTLKNLALNIEMTWINGKYPEKIDLPQDPKEWQKSEFCEFTYKYEVSEDRKEYKLTTCLEKEHKDFPNHIYTMTGSLK